MLKGVGGKTETEENIKCEKFYKLSPPCEEVSSKEIKKAVGKGM